MRVKLAGIDGHKSPSRRGPTWAVALVLTIAVCTGVSIASALSPTSSTKRRQIVDAVRAPFVAFVAKDPQALCSAFTPGAATYLAKESKTADCAERVAQAFAAAEPIDEQLAQGLMRVIEVTRVRRHGKRASALLSLGKDSHKSLLELVLISGRWRIATHPLFVLTNGCHHRVGATGCPPDARIILFGIINPASSGPTTIPPPAAVRHAGGKELREFKAGALVAAQAGCLACHRIGNQGKPGPGPTLTHVGSRLTEAQISRAIIDPSEPMPSFKNLPKNRFRSLIRFLALMQ